MTSIDTNASHSFDLAFALSGIARHTKKLADNKFMTDALHAAQRES